MEIIKTENTIARIEAALRGDCDESKTLARETLKCKKG